tara:strand:+ start:11373 stop:12353 length:981 start_codon:yes stop_codon:yes gene_type:complete
MINKKNILVTGGAGYIGSHIVEVLVKKKFNVFIFDNLITGYKKLIHKKAKFIKGDTKNFKKLSSVIRDNNIFSVIHLAAYLNIKESEKKKNKYYKNNVIGTINLIKACKNSTVKNLIFSSSCSVYGEVNGPVAEKRQLRPKSYYGYTKYKSEKAIIKYSKICNYKFAILRYFNVAGASNSGKIGEIQNSHGHLFKNLAIQSTKNKPIVNIYGKNYNTTDGTCIRDYIHVSDLADIHVKVLANVSKYRKSLVLNCGYGKGFSVYQIVRLFVKIKKNAKVNFLRRRPGDVAQIYANTKKLKKILRWKPKFNNIYNILKSAIKWENKIN